MSPHGLSTTEWPWAEIERLRALNAKLLAALEDAVELLEELEDFDCDKPNTLSQARAAIAEATSKNPYGEGDPAEIEGT